MLHEWWRAAPDWDLLDAPCCNADLLQPLAETGGEPEFFEAAMQECAMNFGDCLLNGSLGSERRDNDSSKLLTRFALRSPTQSFSTFNLDVLSPIFARLKKWIAFPLDPHSRLRSTWDVSLALLLLFDVLMLPYETFVLGGSVTFPALQLTSAVFWSMDLCLGFVTAYYVDATLIRDMRSILRRYARGWMLIDVTIVSLDWMAIGTADAQVSFATFFRTLRVARFVRLVRLLQLRRRVDVMVEVLQVTPLVVHVFASLGLVLSLLAASHVLTCIWVYVGVQSHGAQRPSWVTPFVDGGAMALYRVGFHWTMCQFHGSMDVQPQNGDERIFTIAVVVVACVTFPFFISSITSRIVRMQSMAAEKSEAMEQLQELLASRKISPVIASFAKKHLGKHFDRKHRADIEKILDALPASVQSDLFFEMRAPALSHAIFFTHLTRFYPRLVRLLCAQALSMVSIGVKETLFRTGDRSSAMLYVEAGTLHYRFGGDGNSPVAARGKRRSRRMSFTGRAPKTSMEAYGSGPVVPMDWICEQSLWAKWHNVGTLESEFNSSLLSMDADSFSRLLASFQGAHVDALLYGRFFVDALLRQRDTGFCTDRGLLLRNTDSDVD